MATSVDSDVPVLQMANLQPYISLTILEITSDDWRGEFVRLMEKLRQRSLKARRGTQAIVTSGVDDSIFESEDCQWLATGAYQVKAAASSHSARRVAVGPYEVVASQAAKNLRYLSPDHLHSRLSSSPIARPASWVDGHRVDGRGEFLEALACRTARDLARVVIVQPHVSEELYTRARSESHQSAENPHNVLRMNLLEALLNSARASVVGLGADFYVIGSKK